MMEIRKEILEAVTAILGENVGVFVFGSRARGDADDFSDYDIGLFRREPISGQAIARIREKLDQSNIPYTVDMVDFAEADPAFASVALQEIEIWKNPDLIEFFIANMKK